MTCAKRSIGLDLSLDVNLLHQAYPRVMHSDAIDQLLSSYLKQPVRMSWKGAVADTIRGSFELPRVELGGIATAWVPFEEVVLEADRVIFHPGIPARLAIEAPRIELAVGQIEIDQWMDRLQLPFRLALEETSLVLKSSIAGFAVGELEASLDVVGGWFVLKPRRASVLGIPGFMAPLFRTYLPLPPLPKDARLLAIGHEPGLLRLTLEADDFEERITPGIVGRLQRRMMPTIGLGSPF
ncbi:MAG: hypothetical protein GY723_11475 [bacterium]|nr:hypothetical protein [bacterium]